MAPISLLVLPWVMRARDLALPLGEALGPPGPVLPDREAPPVRRLADHDLATVDPLERIDEV
jgi:hypothetical protein